MTEDCAVLGLPDFLEVVDLLVLVQPLHDRFAGLRVHLEDRGTDEFVDLLRGVLVDEVPHLHIRLLCYLRIFERIRSL